jgi:perosamine synthetase
LAWKTFSGARNAALPSVLDAKHIRFTTSGRAAIALALRALGVGEGHSVLVPTYHCPTMIAPVVATGAKPVFFPIDDSGAPRLEDVPRSVVANTRALIAAHYFGLPQPMAALRAFCDAHGISLIEDCAHALFGLSDGRPVGRWGDFAIASLTKFLPVLDGGCIISPRAIADLPQASPLSARDQIKILANVAEMGARYDRLPGANAVLSGVFSIATRLRNKPLPSSVLAGASARGSLLGDTEAAMFVERDASWWTRWTVKHAHRARIVTLRRRNYQQLAHLVAGIDGVRPLMPSLPDDAVPYVFPLLVERPQAIYAAVRAAGVPVFRWDELWPGCPVIAGDEGRKWASHVFQIGCHQELRPEDIAAIVAVLRTLVESDKGHGPVPVLPVTSTTDRACLPGD